MKILITIAGDGEVEGWGDGVMGRWGGGEVGEEKRFLPMPNAPCPMPNAQCPITNN